LVAKPISITLAGTAARDHEPNTLFDIKDFSKQTKLVKNENCLSQFNFGNGKGSQ
jgi:hypothetical protein